jgi:hypothetical protein
MWILPWRPASVIRSVRGSVTDGHLLRARSTTPSFGLVFTVFDLEGRSWAFGVSADSEYRDYYGLCGRQYVRSTAALTLPLL